MMSLHKRVSNILKEFARHTSSSPKNYIIMNKSNHEAIVRTTKIIILCSAAVDDKQTPIETLSSEQLQKDILQKYEYKA